VRKLLPLILTLPLLLLAGCGGGGGGGTTTTGPTPPSTPPTQSMATAGPPNVESMTIDTGPAGLSPPAVNTAYISVTICVPGTQTCETIDHVEIDTGSIGLRLLASAVGTLPLPAVTDATINGNPLAECLTFADNTSSYGSVNVADVTLPVSGEAAANINVQIIGATSAGSQGNASNPACAGTANNTVDTFGANGILGVGPVLTDCNTAGPCAPGGASAVYYSCPTATSCSGFSATVAEQLQNPVSLFATDNNGVIVELPTISPNGAVDPTPAVIVFGIGTQSNNALGSAIQLLADPDTGEISATLNGGAALSAYMDSGSNANFFTDSSLATCGPGANSTFYCPTATVTEDVILTGFDGSAPTVGNFNVADATTLFSNVTFTAFNDLGAPAFSGSTSTLDLGLPFFYGHNIYLAIETPSNPTPYFALAAN
jgi:hypothetical protein